MTCTIVVGGQWGDEGKGKIISYLCSKDNPSIVARGGVGPNAGHTVEVNGKKYGIRMVPTGFPNRASILAIGAGVLVDPEVLLKEIEMLNEFRVGERLIVDYNCGIIE
ncbi:MAG TPA: adenylosuccinate synthetase, partial [Methanothermococcus okinawensis]|nr:adenylosuccinate synthetase [Methanothermococcus okinawensis]